MTRQECKANLKRIKDMTWGLKESAKITKDRLGFAPIELSKAIGSLSKAECELETAIAKIP